MSGIVIDTSVWIDFFGGRDLPELESALKEGRVVLTPVVIAELMSGALSSSKEKQLIEILEGLEIHPTPRAHWLAVGRARRLFHEKGLKVSIPDAHIAQCALETNGLLYSFDRIFAKIAKIIPLRLLK